MDLSFFSDEITSIMLDISEICFDGTFFTVPVQFYQLWTIFIVIDQHVLPAIHCLLTGKSEELYQAVLSKIQEILPQFQPQIAMSDWEQAARNAFKTLFIGIKLQGCWFHYTQRIWKKVQKVNLATTYTNNGAFQNYLRCIMALPFLPPDENSLHTNKLIHKISISKSIKWIVWRSSNYLYGGGGLIKFYPKNYLFGTRKWPQITEQKIITVD